MGGMVTCRKCGRSTLTIVNIGMVATDGENCPYCKMETPEAEPGGSLPWAIPPAPPKSELEQLRDVIAGISDEEHAYLEGPAVSIKDGLKAIVAEAERDWQISEKVDLADRVYREEERRKKRPGK